ncbi:cupin domain-containing protein [Chitinimonas sp. BJB300]|uniref:cupin domain-containing protein n=1 Tax=Chitinimonas sp. BJB300 TaxID=1559339 RepID=UPI000C0F1AD9|nr:cupin domain-containing protein [Chitinimonas sp. BJB300]PHV11916.1 hypothetical protein CSQ89_08315 [Chitinimonas sp. BJB300]TSJ84457.1 cupin domain-containing protein [Chitinimonas sp. BJB300]
MNFVNWLSILASSQYDPVAGIKIAKLSGDHLFSTYLTEIDPGKFVNPHFHKHGNEHYHIIQGQGKIELTDALTGISSTRTVEAFSSFVVEENVIHSLTNIGDAPLILMFSCPEAHLTDDRHLPVFNGT